MQHTSKQNQNTSLVHHAIINPKEAGERHRAQYCVSIVARRDIVTTGVHTMRPYQQDLPTREKKPFSMEKTDSVIITMTRRMMFLRKTVKIFRW
jgi:hypothetical protein